MFFGKKKILIHNSPFNYLIVLNSGLMGLLLRFITPLTITPSVAMIGIALFEPASNFASSHWGISIG